MAERNRILLGKKGSDYGLWVSKYGKNATSTDRDDLIFDSTDLHSSGVYAFVDITISSGTNSASASISNLGYIPYVLWVELDGNAVSGRAWEFQFSGFGGSIIVGHIYKCEVQNNSVAMLKARGNNVSSNKTFRCAVFAVPAT